MYLFLSLGSVTIVSTNIIIPTGLSFTGSVGSISPVIPKTVELGSVSFNATVDSLTTTADANVSLTGQAITGANGVITPADQVMGLTGVSFTANLGTAVAPNEDVTLTGQAITSTQGTAVGFGGSVVFPTGFSITSAQGTAIAPNNAQTLSGQEASLSVGTLVGLGSSVANLTGVSIDRFCGKYITCRYDGINRRIIYRFCRISRSSRSGYGINRSISFFKRRSGECINLCRY